MAFTDYEFYINEYRGNSIPESDFEKLESKAAFEVNRLTFNRAGLVITENTNDSLIEKIGLATCEVAEVLFSYSVGADVNPAVASEKVGDYSVQYASAEARKSAINADIAGVVERYLELTGLMYRGVA